MGAGSLVSRGTLVCDIQSLLTTAYDRVCVLWKSCDDHDDMNFVLLFLTILLPKIAASAVLNGIYDAVLETFLTCPCVQEGCPKWLNRCCDGLSVVQLLIQTSAGVIVSLLALAALAWSVRKEDRDHTMVHYLMVAVRELIIGKFLGLFVVTMALDSLGFLKGRREQMKPARSDTQARQNWDNHQPKRCGGRAPNSLWNKFIGSEKEVEDLPEVAPTYDIDVKICGRRI